MQNSNPMLFKEPSRKGVQRLLSLFFWSAALLLTALPARAVNFNLNLVAAPGAAAAEGNASQVFSADIAGAGAGAHTITFAGGGAGGILAARLAPGPFLLPTPGAVAVPGFAANQLTLTFAGAAAQTVAFIKDPTLVAAPMQIGPGNARISMVLAQGGNHIQGLLLESFDDDVTAIVRGDAAIKFGNGLVNYQLIPSAPGQLNVGLDFNHAAAANAGTATRRVGNVVSGNGGAVRIGANQTVEAVYDAVSGLGAAIVPGLHATEASPATFRVTKDPAAAANTVLSLTHADRVGVIQGGAAVGDVGKIVFEITAGLPVKPTVANVFNTVGGAGAGLAIVNVKMTDGILDLTEAAAGNQKIRNLDATGANSIIKFGANRQLTLQPSRQVNYHGKLEGVQTGALIVEALAPGNAAAVLLLDGGADSVYSTNEANVANQYTISSDGVIRPTTANTFKATSFINVDLRAATSVLDLTNDGGALKGLSQSIGQLTGVAGSQVNLGGATLKTSYVAATALSSIVTGSAGSVFEKSGATPLSLQVPDQFRSTAAAGEEDLTLKISQGAVYCTAANHFQSNAAGRVNIELGTNAANPTVFDLTGGNPALSTNQSIGKLTGAKGSTVLLGNASQLTMKPASDCTFEGVITGAAGSNIIKEGPALFTMKGDSPQHLGSLTINGGAVSVNGKIASNVVVNNGATLKGNAEIGSLTLADGGILSPGNSIGQIRVLRDYNPSATSVYKVEFNSKGESDKLIVLGVSNLNGIVQFVPELGGTFKPGTAYEFFTGQGNVVGQFASANFASPKGITGLSGQKPTYTVTIGANGKAIFTVSEDLSKILNAATQSTTPRYAEASVFLQIDSLRRKQGLVSQHLQDLSATQSSNKDVWATVYGANGKLKDQDKSRAYKSTSYGVLLGKDLISEDGVRLGAALGYEHQNTKHTVSNNAKGKTQQFNGGVYASYELDGWYLEADAWLQYSRTKYSRVVPFLAASNYKGKSKGFAGLISGTAGYMIPYEKMVTFMPYVNVNVYGTKDRGFTDRSSALSNQVFVRGRKMGAIEGKLGVRISCEVATGAQVYANVAVSSCQFFKKKDLNYKFSTAKGTEQTGSDHGMRHLRYKGALALHGDLGVSFKVSDACTLSAGVGMKHGRYEKTQSVNGGVAVSF